MVRHVGGLAFVWDANARRNPQLIVAKLPSALTIGAGMVGLMRCIPLIARISFTANAVTRSGNVSPTLPNRYAVHIYYTNL